MATQILHSFEFKIFFSKLENRCRGCFFHVVVLCFHKENVSKHTPSRSKGLLTTLPRTSYQRQTLYLIRAGEKKGKKLWLQREMKQFCLCLLCYLARTAQINYSHLPHSIHYSSCKHISQMKCLPAHLAFLSFPRKRTGWFRFPARCEQSIKETQHHFWDRLPAASSTDSCLPGSLNV